MDRESSSRMRADVYWVEAENGSRYSQSPQRMRSFRNLDEAYSFILLSLDPSYRRDVRILTSDKTLMIDDVIETNAVAISKMAQARFGAISSRPKVTMPPIRKPPTRG